MKHQICSPWKKKKRTEGEERTEGREVGRESRRGTGRARYHDNEIESNDILNNRRKQYIDTIITTKECRNKKITIKPLHKSNVTRWRDVKNKLFEHLPNTKEGNNN